MTKSTVQNKHAALQTRLRELQSVLVAFSGGVDSALLLRVAVDTLGREHVLAATGRSPSIPQAELDAAAGRATEAGAAHVFVDTHEFDDPNYTSNPANRCYFCKVELFGELRTLAATRGLQAIITGANADDYDDHRPGHLAASELRIHAPLADVGFTKADVRTLAAELGLSVADKPAAPCLSSRIPYGQDVTPEKLHRIDAAETLLHDLGFAECRVRHHEDLARIEVLAQEIGRFADAQLRNDVFAKLRALGFTHVALDLRGFRSGNLNEVLVGDRLRAAAVNKPSPAGTSGSEPSQS